MKIPLLAASLLFVVGCGTPKTEPTTTTTPTAPAKPGFKNVVLTDDEGTKAPKSVFGVNAPKIIVFFDFENVKSGSKLKGAWICEKSDAAPPNYKIDEATVEAGMLTNSGNFSLSKPTKGWPEGTYHVALSIDDQEMETVKFEVKR